MGHITCNDVGMGDALVLALDHPDCDLAAVGGKAASLARLAVAGLPVPPGFSVTTRAYRDFVSSGPTADIQAALRDVDFADPAAVDGAAAAIVFAFNRFEMPAAITSAIRSEYSGMQGAVAVRSSAGQHDTFLNITGADAVLEAVKCCWASL